MPMDAFILATVTLILEIRELRHREIKEFLSNTHGQQVWGSIWAKGVLAPGLGSEHVTTSSPYQKAQF